MYYILKIFQIMDAIWIVRDEYKKWNYGGAITLWLNIYENFRWSIEWNINEFKLLLIKIINNEKTKVSIDEVKTQKLKEWIKLNKISIETTVDDLLNYPSYINPVPEKWIPQINTVSFLAGWCNTWNKGIKYSDWSIYSWDFVYDDWCDFNPEDGYKWVELPKNYWWNWMKNWTWKDFDKSTRNEISKKLISNELELTKKYKYLWVQEDEHTYAFNIENKEWNLEYTDFTFSEEQYNHILKSSKTQEKALFSLFNRTIKLIEEGYYKEAINLLDFSLGWYGWKEKIEAKKWYSLTSFNLDSVLKFIALDFQKKVSSYWVFCLKKDFLNHKEMTEHINNYIEIKAIVKNENYYIEEIEKVFKDYKKYN